MCKRISSHDLLRSGVTGGGCYTEPGGGSDVASVKRAGPGSINTTYRKVDGGYIINGTKSFVTNGGRACFYMVMATEDVARGRPDRQ